MSNTGTGGEGQRLYSCTNYSGKCVNTTRRYTASGMRVGKA